MTPNSRLGLSDIHSVSGRPSPSTSIVGCETAPAGKLAEFAGHPPPVAVAVLVAVGVGLSAVDGVLELVDTGGAPVAVGVGDGMRKQPLSSTPRY